MENNLPINSFDAMLKQSLEGSQMPVPSGVWETVGSSIGAKAIIATKVASLKLIILKTVAGLVFTGGAVYGVYELIKSQENSNTENSNSVPLVSLNNQNPDSNVSTIEIPFTRITADERKHPVFKDSVQSNNSTQIYQNSFIADTIREAILPSESNSEGDNGGVSSDNSGIKKPTAKTESPKTTEPKTETPVKTPAKEIPYNEEKYSSNDIVIPDVFTPNDLDGKNDCYQVIIENETKFVLQIFDMNNKRVFETTDKNKCWDGRNMNTGQMCPKGIYIYKLIYELKSGYNRTVPGQLTLY